MKEVEEQHDIGTAIWNAGAVAHHIAQHRRYIGKAFRARLRRQPVEQRLFDVDRDNLATCAARGGQSEGAITGADIDDCTFCTIKPQCLEDARRIEKRVPIIFGGHAASLVFIARSKHQNGIYSDAMRNRRGGRGL